jgi:MFS family permease
MNIPRLTWVQWLICAIASIGFAFDIYELLMLPLVVRPALMELAGLKPGMPAFNQWTGLLFWIPAIAGGLFGLLGGYLTDRFGRRRVLVWSILLYAFSAAAAGFSTSIEMLLFLRTTTFIGVCVEFVAAVAWLAELFPEPKQREAVLGYTQAFSSIGGLLVTGATLFRLHGRIHCPLSTACTSPGATHSFPASSPRSHSSSFGLSCRSPPSGPERKRKGRSSGPALGCSSPPSSARPHW